VTHSRVTRRRFLSAAAGLALTGCATSRSSRASTTTSRPSATTEPTVTATAATSPPSIPVAPTPTTSGGTAATPVGSPATFVDHGSASANAIALTFHLSGAPSLVTAMLDLLKSRALPVTAFAVGTWITANPQLTRRLVADGHELANHTEHHLAMDSMTPGQIYDEIVQCGQALTAFIGSAGRWFRPSSTVVPSQTILDQAGRAGYPISVGYDIDSTDNTDPGQATIISRVNAAMHPGAVVSLHFGHRGTIDALPHLLDHIDALGLRPVTIGALLG
jgi:peptidoglycan/xylan/chitin deacetylase (PgdA/CDA1 family)